MPDYAEVAGCSTFKNTTSPLYDSYGAYATTNLVRNANVFANSFHNNNKNGIYPPASANFHYNNKSDGHNFTHSESNLPTTNNKTTKMNIIENKMDIINNLNRSAGLSAGLSGGASANNVSATPIIGIGTMRRNRLPKVGHCDKISFGGCDSGRPMDQPLFVKSKEDGTWASVQNSSYHFATPNNGDNSHKINGSCSSVGGGNGHNHTNNGHGNIGSNHSIGGNSTPGSQIYLSSFGKYDNV